ncbi:hypothetical protein HYDPIDRAFT_92997, partial [Hydnomerulius pinastri MD-312]
MKAALPTLDFSARSGVDGGDCGSLLKDLVQSVLKYAILSHRWLRDGEPTFQDMTKGEILSSQGFHKLQKFCEKAKAHGCLLAWSDTCCIDKTSSTELDEAIRSMFRWYRNSHVCVVYLAQSSKIGDLQKEEWFERGWTLQELLAPRSLKFYGQNWTPLGADALSNDKEDEKLLRAVCTVTHIPIDDLRDFVPGMTMVREKMIWASKRRTTRAEDIAYSLIGIFDVNLSVAYGEGDWAFHRLMEVIIHSSDEWGIFAWAGP